MSRHPRYRGTPIHGLLPVDKPVGIGSTEVVRQVRFAAGDVKTGHAGTLDPLASGLLICCLGDATTAVERLMGMPKLYLTDIDLSAFTTTDDAEGERQPVAVTSPPDQGRIEALLPTFVGSIQQRPPAYSACKIAGRPAYTLARMGQAPELAPRQVAVYFLELVSFVWPILSLRVACGRGMYVRVLARDLGLALGTGGHLAALRRLAIGPFTVEQAVPLASLPQPITQEHLRPMPHSERS